MICYLDKTFCKSDCINSSCHRRLTDAVIDGAAKWWGSDDAPIAVSDFSKHCTEYQLEGSKTND